MFPFYGIDLSNWHSFLFLGLVFFLNFFFSFFPYLSHLLPVPCHLSSG
jgi:hypothetical protein